jgi:hypothetical protein
MPINIRIDAEVEGKKLKFTFNWEGDHNEIANVMDRVRRLADKAGVTPRVYAQSVLHHLPAMGVLEVEDGRQMQMMAITFAVLDLAEKQIDLPAAIADLAEHQLIDATLLVRDDEYSLKISGSSEFELVH